MSDCFFRRRIPIEVEITIERNDVVETAVSTLNKIAEARFDGQNTQYVNNMQPEVDFEQDKKLVYDYYADGVANIVRRIEPYVESWEHVEDKANDTVDDSSHSEDINTVFHLVFPESWKANQQPVLMRKMENYLVTYIITQWLEKVSMNDTAYTMEKAAQLLRDIKGVCELRKGKVHRIWNGTY